MAFQDADITFPEPPLGMDLISAGGLDSTLMDATGEKIAYILVAPKDGTLENVGFLTGTVTTGDNLKVSFQDRTTTDAFPDGTIDQYRVITIADGDDDVWKTTGIISSDGTDGGTKRTVSKGDIFFIVFEFDSYVAGNLNLKNAGIVSRKTYSGDNRYVVFDAGAGWVDDVDNTPIFSLKYDDGTYAYIPGVIPGINIGTQVDIDTGTTPDEVALIFQVPFSCKVGGAWAIMDVDGEVDIILYDSDGSTVLATLSIDRDNRQESFRQPYSMLFSSEIPLTINTDYYLAFKPTTATNAKLGYLEVDSAAILDQMQGGQNLRYAERTDAGSWSTTTTKRPYMGIFISALDDGVGGGGGMIVHPGMGGGLD